MSPRNELTPDDTSSWNRHLVEPDWLQEVIESGRSDLAVVDMRGYVKTSTDPNGRQSAEYLGAREDYRTAHIPGAVYVDWTTDIADTSNPVPAQVADGSQISALFGGMGIGNETCIVAYDDHPSMQLATRLWWVCRYFGSNNVRVLHGGWARWLREGRPVSSADPAREPRAFNATPNAQWIASAQDVLQILGDSGVRIVDARDEGQFTGRIRRGKRGGHIPGAIHLPREAIFDSPGQLMPPAALREIFSVAGIIGANQIGADDEPVIVAYCNGGVAATSVLFALSIIGCARLTNYDGSWNEWNMDDSLPIEPH